MQWIIVGLGNPGGEYIATRHNTGRIALEEFRATHDFPDWEEKKIWKAIASVGKVGKADVLLLEPETMMNNSGKSLLTLVKSKKQAERLVVIHDDLDLPLGKWKFSFNRGSGGHKGIESIARAIKTKAFVRVRVGISLVSKGNLWSALGGLRVALGNAKMKKPHGEDAVVKFILGKFTNSELVELKKVSKEIAQGLETLLTHGLEKAMSEYNR